MRTPDKDELRLISEATLKKTAAIGLRHAKENLPYKDKTINDIKKEISVNSPNVAVVVCAGPSLHKNRHIEILRKIKDKVVIVAVESTMAHCLKNSIIPHYVISVDPDEHRIIRWFGDPRIEHRPEDDYFRRQDLDPSMRKDEKRRNEEIIELVNRYGSGMKAVLSTSVTPEITRRCIEAGIPIYWWNPLYDDYNRKDSISRQVYRLNEIPCMVSGGNVGTSAWVFANAVLNCLNTIIVGMDFSYPPGTKTEETQYYDKLLEIYPDNPKDGLIEIYNPYLAETWITDVAYYWYRESFLKMAEMADSKTYNCTEGGILFGGKVEFVRFNDCLAKLNII